jgi:hypothetical protein
MVESHNHESEHSTDIVANSEPEKAALEALTLYMKSWNNRDIAGMDAAFHFPHVRIASGQISILEKTRMRSRNFFESFIKNTGWDYSLWDYRRAVQSKEDKVHFAVQFTRYRKDGIPIGQYPSLWIVALIDGKWGVQARSSFAP